MGAEPWSCFAPYQPDVAAALADAQAREFAAGRFRMLDPDDPPATIEEACLAAAEDGTASVLDMIGVAETPHEPMEDILASGRLPDQFGMVAPLGREQLLEFYGTEKPTRDLVETNDEIYEGIDRGLGVYVIVYEDDAPSEIFFAGYSFD